MVTLVFHGGLVLAYGLFLAFQCGGEITPTSATGPLLEMLATRPLCTSTCSAAPVCFGSSVVTSAPMTRFPDPYQLELAPPPPELPPPEELDDEPELEEFDSARLRSLS